MGRTGIYACGESVSRCSSSEPMALFSLKQEAPASIGGSTFTTGKVVDLETTAALIPEITLMYHGEKYKFQDHVFIVKGGEDDSVKYLVYDELNDSLFCVVEKKLPNSQWLREKYRLVSSTEESKLKPYLRYIQNENDWVYIQKR